MSSAHSQQLRPSHLAMDEAVVQHLSQVAIRLMDYVHHALDLVLDPPDLPGNAGDVFRLGRAPQVEHAVGGVFRGDLAGALVVDQEEDILHLVEVDAEELQPLLETGPVDNDVEDGPRHLRVRAVCPHLEQLAVKGLRQRVLLLILELCLKRPVGDQWLANDVDDQAGNDVRSTEHGDEDVRQPHPIPSSVQGRERRRKDAPIAAGDSSEECERRPAHAAIVALQGVVQVIALRVGEALRASVVR
mmetsp:Transcript_9952/g.28912  ORF Transcript_9952/g.28912 Transcript_9952/m.28912 type:complete len:245 (-) Transcript_9952:1558-2292(-)